MKLDFNMFHLNIGTKEFIAIICLIIFLLIAIKPDTFILIMDQIINLFNVPGFQNFVLAFNTNALQNFHY